MIRTFLQKLIDKILAFFGSVEAKARQQADALVAKESQIETAVRTQVDKVIPPKE